MKKLVLVFYILLGLDLKATAQIDSLSDILPFSIGTEWSYSFSLTSVIYHFASTDTGNVSYIVVGNLISQDQTVWHLMAKRQFTRYTYGYPSQYIEDSKYFDIVELHQGQHKLYTPNFDQFSLFPFFSSAPDSESFYRYQQTDNDGNLTFGLSFYPTPSTPEFAYSVTYLLTKNIGIVNSNASQFKGFPNSFIRAKYYFKDIQTHSINAHLIIEDFNFEISTLFGEPKELKIPLNNDGLETLNISNIQISDSRIYVKNIPSEIPGLGIDTLVIEFNSPIPDIFNASIIINSNSITNWDTIYILAKAISAPRIDLPSWINFEPVLSGETSIYNLVINNTGNISWIFDSIQTEFPQLNIQSVTSPLEPNHSGSLILSFLAPDTGYAIWDKLIVYSNSLNSPDTINILAVYVIPAQLSFSTTSLDFGNVEIGKQKELILQISNAREFSEDIRRSNPTDPFFCPQSEYFWINGNDFFVDTIVFKPDARGTFYDKIIYTTSSTGGIVSRIDTVYISGMGTNSEEINFTLYQNFPNPFNSGTIIWYDLESKGFVNLKIFDILGNEIITLINEEKPAGVFEIKFFGNGLANGVYLYRLQAGEYVETKKMILLK